MRWLIQVRVAKDGGGASAWLTVRDVTRPAEFESREDADAHARRREFDAYRIVWANRIEEDVWIVEHLDGRETLRHPVYDYDPALEGR